MRGGWERGEGRRGDNKQIKNNTGAFTVSLGECCRYCLACGAKGVASGGATFGVGQVFRQGTPGGGGGSVSYNLVATLFRVASRALVVPPCPQETHTSIFILQV